MFFTIIKKTSFFFPWEMKLNYLLLQELVNSIHYKYVKMAYITIN